MVVVVGVCFGGGCGSFIGVAFAVLGLVLGCVEVVVFVSFEAANLVPGVDRGGCFFDAMEVEVVCRRGEGETF